MTDDLLRVEVRRFADLLESTQRDLRTLADTNAKLAGHVERVGEGRLRDAGDLRLVAAAVQQTGFRVGGFEVALANITQRLEQEGVLRRTETALVTEKLDKIEEDTQRHRVVDIREAAGVSKPPPGYAGAIREFGKWPRADKILILLFLLLWGGHAYLISYVKGQLAPQSTPTSDHREP